MATKADILIKSACFLLLVLVTCFSASAEYVITPHDPDIPPELIDSSGADSTETFRELPLFFKLIAIGALFSFWSLSLVKFLPLLLGKIKLGGGGENRETIISFISANPGCTESEILKSLGMKRGTFRYHVDKLKQANMLVSPRNGRLTRYFHRDFSTDQGDGYFDSIKNDTRKNVLETILEVPGVTGKDLSAKLGVDKSTIHWHVNKLDEENFIRSERHGKFKRYYPQSRLQTSTDHGISVLSD